MRRRKIVKTKLLESRKYKYIFILFLLTLFHLYLMLLAREITPGSNHGELIAVSRVLGIPHPTGYPLFSMAGFAATLIPFGNVAMRVNLMCALFQVGLVFMTYSILKTLGVRFPVRLLFCVFPAMELLFLQQAVAAEVYGLHLFLLSLFVFALLKFNLTRSVRWFYLACFVFGLSLSNHLLSIFFMPLFFSPPLFSRLRRKISGAVFLIAGLSVYLYIPIRADVLPIAAWGTPNNIFSFIQHLSGTQFQGLMFQAPLHTMKLRFISGLRFMLFSGWNSVLIICFILGITAVFPRKKPVLSLLFAAGILNCVFSLGYNIHDIDVYFLPAIWIFFIISAIGLNRQGEGRISLWFLYPVFIAAVGYSLLNAYQRADLSENNLAYSYGKALLNSTPPHAVFRFQGDNAMNSLVYLRVVEHRRPDVTFVDTNGNFLPIRAVSRRSRPPFQVGSYRGISGRDQAYPSGCVYIRRNADQVSSPDPEIFSGLYRVQDYYLDNYSRELLAEFFINRAEFECERGDWSRGLRNYQRAADFAKDNPDVSGFIASLMASRGLMDQAVRIETDYLQNFPFNPRIANNLAYHLYLENKNLSMALRISEKAAAMSPATPAYHITLARLLFLTGDVSRAARMAGEYNIRDLQTEITRWRRFTQVNKISDSELKALPGRFRDIPVLYSAGLFSIVRAVGIDISRERLLTENECSLFVNAAKAGNAPQAAIYVLENLRKRFVLPDPCFNLLIALHKRLHNTARIKMLNACSVSGQFRLDSEQRRSG